MRRAHAALTTAYCPSSKKRGMPECTASRVAGTTVGVHSSRPACDGPAGMPSGTGGVDQPLEGTLEVAEIGGGLPRLREVAEGAVERLGRADASAPCQG